MPSTLLSSRLPKAPGNLFQTVKGWRTEAASRGIKILNLGIGQPSGPALLSAREAAAKAVMSETESMHEYQDNGSPGVPDFAKRFAQHNVMSDLSAFPGLEYLPVPGLKSMLGLVPLACGASKDKKIAVATMTDPGYPTPAYWSKLLPGVIHRAIKLSTDNGFLFSIDEIIAHGALDLIMLNYPHNPSGKAAERDWLEQLCIYAEENEIRLWNDGAYAVLAHSEVHTTLTDVAVNHPNLSWAEGFSASKAIGNGTGWRVGSIVGSADFVRDLTRIKGDADSGFVAFAAAGVIHAFDHDRKSISASSRLYAERLTILIEALEKRGMRLAVKPDAGFFTLWQVPVRAFGQKIEDAGHFNRLMIENTGVLGVHFNPGYIRYAVTGHVHQMLREIEVGFEKATVSY